MRVFICVAVLMTSFVASAAVAQTTQAAPTHYTTADTTIGTLLDDPAARVIVDAHIPGFSTSGNIDMARAMTLKSVQQFAPDTVTDQVLAEIDADLAKLPAKK